MLIKAKRNIDVISIKLIDNVIKIGIRHKKQKKIPRVCTDPVERMRVNDYTSGVSALQWVYRVMALVGQSYHTSLVYFKSKSYWCEGG